MVSVAAGYVYTFAAITAVSTLLIFSFSAYANTLQAVPEAYKLRAVLNQLAAKATEVSAFAVFTNSTVKSVLEMPSAIGDRAYWVRLRNDSARAWVEGGFGRTPTDDTWDLRVYLPRPLNVSGCYFSGYGFAVLECLMVDETPSLVLSFSGGGS